MIKDPTFDDGETPYQHYRKRKKTNPPIDDDTLRLMGQFLDRLGVNVTVTERAKPLRALKNFTLVAIYLG